MNLLGDSVGVGAPLSNYSRTCTIPLNAAAAHEEAFLAMSGTNRPCISSTQRNAAVIHKFWQINIVSGDGCKERYRAQLIESRSCAHQCVVSEI